MSAPSSNGTAAAPLARNDYREGQVLRARDLERESGYFLARDRQHAALAHIPGIVRGLALRVFERGTENVVLPEDLKESKPLDLFLEAGVAVDGYGRLVSVPRREQVSTALATAPSLLRAGRYRVELLYDRSVEGTGGGAGGDPCGGLSPGAGGGRTVREGYRLRLVEAGLALEPPAIGAVLDGPPDAPEAEAPVVLGTVDWNGSDAFVGFSLQGRVYAGVRAEVVASPDERTELDLRDAAGRVAVRFAPEAAAGQAPVFSDAVRIDDQGGVWVRGDVDAGPDGIRFRPQRDAQGASNWRIGLRDEPGGGSSFGKKPGKQPGAEEKVGPPPEYAAGEREMRIVFERADQVGKRRVVVGHVDQAGEFLPSVIVYDRPPQAAAEGSSTVEIWGDLFVRGTTYLTGVQRVPPGSAPQTDDQLDLLLRQLAGPLAGAFRAFLLSDPDWLAALGDLLADRVPKDAAFVEAVSRTLRQDDAFIDSVASGALDDLILALRHDDGLLTALVDRLRMHRGLVAALSVELRSHTTFITDLGLMLAGSEAVIRQLSTRLADSPDFLDRLSATLAGREPFRTQIIGLVVQHLTTHTETLQTLAQALAPYLGDPDILQEMLKVLVAALEDRPTDLKPMLEVAVRPAIQGSRAKLDAAVAALSDVVGAWYDGLSPPRSPPTPPTSSPSSLSNQQGEA